MSDPDHEDFLSIPWCAKLLRQKDVVVIATPSRQRKDSTENELVAVTLQTEKTIRSWVTFYKRPLAGANRVDEVYYLLSLGPGINGYAHLAAGGILGVIFDECMGNLGLVNRSLGFEGAAGFMFTANLHINYVKPVPTPGVYLVTATLREVKGRKCYFVASIKDGDGIVLSTAESLWIEAAAKL